MRYTIDAAHARLNPKKRQACFELLGFDFMLDAVWKSIHAIEQIQEWGVRNLTSTQVGRGPAR